MQNIVSTLESVKVADTAAQLEAIAQKIEGIEGAALFEIATLAAEAHALFRYNHDEGGYAGWMGSRLGIRRSNAYRLLDVHKRFGSESVPNLGHIGRSAVFLLAAPSTPQSAREEVINQVKAGQKPSYTAVAAIVARHKAGPEVSDAAAESSADISAEPESNSVSATESDDAGPRAATVEPDDKPEAEATGNEKHAIYVFRQFEWLEPEAQAKFFDKVTAAIMLEVASREFKRALCEAMPSNPFLRLAGMNGVEIADELADRLTKATVTAVIKRLHTRSGTKPAGGKVHKFFTMDSAAVSRGKESQH
jgi:hypothetical protein